MLPEKSIQTAVDRIVAATRPTKVTLFGSYAHGDATEDSDLDLIVVEPDIAPEQVAREMVRLRRAVGPVGVGVDLLVYSEMDFDKRKSWCFSPILLGRA